jgi:hypothetical protein
MATVCAARAAEWQSHPVGPRRAQIAGDSSAMAKSREKSAGKSRKPGGKSAARGRGPTLSVSYGTFSCTLSGYDDPAAVVGAIAAQFHAIAAADPRFALAAPTVDVDLLREIAAQELRRQVDLGLVDTATIVEMAGAPRAASPAAAFRPPHEAEDAEIAPAPESRPAAEPEAPAQDRTPATRDGDDVAERLLRRAETQLGGEQAQRRAATIAQLRAAVAAAAMRADRPAGRAAARQAGAAAAAPDDPPPGSRLPAAADAPLPPLRLGPELRVDADPETTPAATTVARFRAAAGAGGAVADRVEAACHFLTVVEGRAWFEPDLVVALLEAAARDEGGAAAPTERECLDAFADLLRRGRLRHLRHARFTLAAPMGVTA